MKRHWLRNPRLVSASAAALLITTAVFFSPAPAYSQSPTAKAIRLQQEALIWTTDYEGRIDGKPGEGTIAAIKKFQRGLGHPETGTLTDSETETLITQGFALRDAVKFKQVTDLRAGVSVGIPTGLLPDPKDVSWGKSWYSKKNELAIDTLRLRDDVSLRALYDKLLSINDRTVAYHRFVEDSWFVIAAFEKGAAVYVRANLVKFADRDPEIRGYSVWMGPNRPKSYQSIAPAMLSSFRSNNDASSDVSVLPMGGLKTEITRKKEEPTIKVEPILESAQIAPIVAPNNRPPSVGSCFKGLGDCPLSAFAFSPR
jgi:peptidoglycan hydrolase-like protein with peptidoglycan-binding domain